MQPNASHAKKRSTDLMPAPFAWIEIPSSGGEAPPWVIINAAESALVHHMFYQMVYHMFTR